MSERASGCLILTTVTVSPLFLHYENTQVCVSYRGSQWCMLFINAKCSLDMKSTIWGKIISAWLWLFHMRFFTRKRFLKWFCGSGGFITRIYVLEYSGKIALCLRKGCRYRAQTGSLLSLAQCCSFILSLFPLSGVTHNFHSFFSSLSQLAVSL